MLISMNSLFFFSRRRSQNQRGMLYYNIYPEWRLKMITIRFATTLHFDVLRISLPACLPFGKPLHKDTPSLPTADQSHREREPPGPFQSFFCFSSAAIFNVSLTKLLSLSLYATHFHEKGYPLIPWHRRSCCLSTSSFTLFFRHQNECALRGEMRKRRGRKSEAEKRMHEDGWWW